METKRCAQCHKLLRAETQRCSRCGYTFVEKKHKMPTRDLTRPSLPPASPHRAGHYSGLHPEDQPYQSSMIAVQRPPVQEPEEMPRLLEALQEVPEQPTLPIPGDDAPTQMSVRYEKRQTETSIPLAPRVEPVPAPRVQREKPLLNTDGALPALYQPQQFQKVRTTKSTIPVLLTLSCIFFLLASGILVYVLTTGKTTPPLQLSANPVAVRAGDLIILSGKGFSQSTQVKFTYDDDRPINDSMGHQLDATADHHGVFSVDVITPTSWSVGVHKIHATDEAQQASISTSITVDPPSQALPLLQLLTTHINLGIDRAGTTSTGVATLKNVGGGSLTWQQKSDKTWLSATPTGNTYTFFGSALITITVNRSNLTPQLYTGHITFTQKDRSNPVELTVMMGVDAAPAALNVSLSSLTFAATSMQSVPTQAVTLQNSGGKPLNWQAAATTSDGANWLSLVDASSGRIGPAQSQQLVVGVQAHLAAGLYQGTIALTGGASATINVSLTVVAPGNILVTPTTLTFSGLTGQSVAGKTLTVQNTGGQAQGWNVTTITADQGSWLSTTAQSGVVNAGTQAQIIVNINIAGLKATSYQGILTFTMGSQLLSVPVTLTLTTPPSATISVQNTSLTFQTAPNTDPVGQSLIITNTGNAILNWTATESGNGATFAPLSPSNGSILPQSHSLMEVNPSVSSYAGGTVLKTLITIADRDTGTTVVSQKIQVTVTVENQAVIVASPTNFSLTASSTNPGTQTVSILNTGSASLNWSVVVHIDTPVGGTWLSVDTLSGTLAPGARKDVVVSCDSTGLASGGQYQGTIQILDSDTGTSVTSQTVYLTFLVP